MEGQLLSLDLGNHAKPTKACVVCGCAIQWRRRRAADWDKLKYCSASCRRVAVASARTAREGRVEDRTHLAGAAPSATRDRVS